LCFIVKHSINAEERREDNFRISDTTICIVKDKESGQGRNERE
jgi:hypothetical protein